jgi:hypothetical protein
MGYKPRKTYYRRKVVKVSKMGSAGTMYIVELECKHCYYRYEEKGSRWPPRYMHCGSCENVDYETEKLRIKLAELESQRYE